MSRNTCNCWRILSRTCRLSEEFFQLAGEGVGVGGRETIGGRSSTTPYLHRVLVSRSPPLRLVASKRCEDGNQPSQNVQHIQRPAALGDGNFF